MDRMVSPSFAALAVCSLLSIAAPPRASAASYLPLSDRDLARRAPIIVRAHVIGHATSLGSIDGQEVVFTRTTLSPIEILKGDMSSRPFAVELPGGESGTVRSWFPGTPDFVEDSEVVLFLTPDPRDAALYRLTELGLSKFDIVSDATGRRFAIRPTFSPPEDDALSRRVGAAENGDKAPLLRDAESFLGALRDSSAAAALAIVYAVPQGELRSGGPVGPRPLWVNIGGVEGSNALFRWFWETGASPDGLVSVAGSQSNLSDGSDGAIHVQNAAAAWRGVPASDVRYSFSASSGNVVVRLDVDDQGNAWSTPIACNQGGVVGYGGPGPSPSAPAFRGDRPYYAIPSGTIWVRRLTGSAGCYPAAVFEAAVLHEMGHTLGLGHPDEAASVHSSPCPFATCTAVMRSTLTGALTPQPDDIAAIQWYYGAPPAAPSASFNAPATALVQSVVTFADASSGNPTSWFWTFGDGGTSSSRNPTHVYTQPGSYTVVLRVSNGAGTATASRAVMVVTCSAGTEVSCRAVPETSAACCRVPRPVPARPPR